MEEKSKKWYIGIDFGTSNTCVVAHEAKEKTWETQSFAGGVGDAETSSVPTLITEEVIEGKPYDYIGTEAQRHPCLRTFRHLKDAARQIIPAYSQQEYSEYPFENCHLNTKLQFGHNDFTYGKTVRELLIVFLRKVLHIGENKYEINKDTLQKIVIGCPAKTVEGSDRVDYKITLKFILAECFLPERQDSIERIRKTVNATFADKAVNGQEKITDKEINECVKGAMQKEGIEGIDGSEIMQIIEKIEVIEEPTLAGVTYLYSEKERENQKILVIDIGGGTTDFSVLEYTKGQPKAKDIGSCNVAGNEIDKMIFDLLPDNMIRSKVQSENCKKRLFAKKVAKSMEPKGMWDLSQINEGNSASYSSGQSTINIHYNQKVGNDCMVLTEGTLYKSGETPISGDSIDVVFNRICMELQKSLDNNTITGITTVLFVGGTSFITPLRKKLLEVVTDSSKEYCAAEFKKAPNVVTMFGEHTRTVLFGSEAVPITCYNAVAFGALITAMGNNIAIQPNITAQIYDGGSARLESTGKELLIATGQAVTFARFLWWRRVIDMHKANYITYKGEKMFRFKFEIDNNSSVFYGIDPCVVDNNEHNIVIFAIWTDGEIDFKAYYYDGDKPPADIQGLKSVPFTKIEYEERK